MSRRGRRLTAALGGLVVLLFVGRWTATLLADRWWAAEFSPAAARFITNWHLLRFTLDLTGFLVASAWFVGHLLLVYRAVGTVQVRRNVANLEFREALTAGALLTIVVVTGVLLGLLTGAGTSGWWRDILLAWHGVSYGISDPLLGRDAGFYVAQLPAWRAVHGFATLLVLLALTGVALLYMLVGAVRLIERRPAINQHARAHLGGLLAALALVLAWGYLLEPYELVAGPAEFLGSSTWRATLMASPLLAGIALATATLSAVWATRPRHALVVAAWIVLAAASIIGHWLLPSILGDSNQPAVAGSSLEHLSRAGYGLEVLEEIQHQPNGQPTPPPIPSLWNSSALAQSFPGDSNNLLLDPAVLTPGGRRRPVWLVVRTGSPTHMSASAVADHRVSSSGEPLFYRLSDTLPRAVPAPLLELPADFLAPDAGEYRLRNEEGPGVTLGGWPRRIFLAWALQSGELFGSVRPGSRVDWRLSPEDRVGRLAPFAEWSAPIARIVAGDLIWLLDGYLSSRTFPLTPRATWRDQSVGSVRAAFLGTVNAETGATQVYLQPGADALAATWGRISGGVVEPTSAIPDAVLRAAPYPGELFRVQIHQLEGAPWKAGVASEKGRESNAETLRPQIGWSPDTSGPLLISTFEAPGERRLSALAEGSRNDGRPQLRLVRLDSSATLPTGGVLRNRWTSFPSYEALEDSIRQDGGQLLPGPVRFEIAAAGPVAYQTYFALRPSGGSVLAWVSVAAPNRLGAGRSLAEAWSNLLGATVPAPPGAAQTSRLDEARRWMDRADSALKRGHWSEFGRAWNSLRKVLGMPSDSARF